MNATSLPGVPLPDDIVSSIEALKQGLVDFATDGEHPVSPDEYSRLRKIIIGLTSREHVPEFLIACRTRPEFWAFIRTKFAHYAERRLYLAQAFNPLLDELEGATHLPGLHYEQGEIIGQGGFGVVYRYHHRLLGMDFAVKVFAPAFSEGGEGHLERFFREARILFALEHPNIVRVHDVGLLGRRPYIRMEMVQGRSLEQVIKQHGRIAPRHALRVVVEIAEALHHAHTVARVVHRDLRPSNVLVSKEPRRRVRLIDFGLGVFIEEEIVSRITREGERAVGGHFTAPELTANPRLLDPRSDIYSLGALWYTLLTGRPPAGINPGVALAAVDGISEVYADTLLQCLADVEHRTRSAEALVEQLRAL